MKWRIAGLLLAAPAFFAAVPGWAAPGPLVVGEEVPFAIESPHPYAGSSTGEPVWSVDLHEPGATYLSVHFAEFDLAPGDVVLVRSPDGSQSYAYEGRGRDDRGSFWAAHVSGDAARVELLAPTGGGFGVRIDRIARGFAPLPEPPGLEDVCGEDDRRNAACYAVSEPGVYDESRAVARLLIQGTVYCTGWLVGCEGHLVTNEHCIDYQGAAADTDYEFLYETPTCGGGGPMGEIWQGAATLIRDDGPLDYALIQLADNPNLTYGFLQLDDRLAVLNERVAIPQHPMGLVKKLAVVSTDPHNPSGFCEIDSLTQPACSFNGPTEIGYYCDSAPGSSGSPVLAYSSLKVIGLHHCSGNPGCDVSTSSPNRAVPIHLIIDHMGAALPECALEDEPVVELVDTILDDSAGNGNGAIDPGETISVAIELSNRGVIPATGVTAVLTSPSAGVTILDDTTDVADVPVGLTSASIAPHLSYSADAGLPCGTVLDFDLAIQSVEGSWSGSFEHRLCTIPDALIVTTTADTADGSCDVLHCSLREAVIASNEIPGPNTIQLAADTYTLTRTGTGEDQAQTGDLDVRDWLILRGAGADATTIDGAGIDRVLDLIGPGIGVELVDLAVTQGFSGQDDGAGARAQNVDLIVRRALFVANTGSELSQGGAIDISGGTLTIDSSAFSQNVSSGGTVYTASLNVDIRDSTFSGPSVFTPLLRLDTSQGPATVTNVTLTSQHSNSRIWHWAGGHPIYVANTIVDGGWCTPTAGGFESLGGNVGAPGSYCDFVHPTDQIDVSSASLALGPLADNGGPTPTHAIGATSAARDAAVNAECGPDDQRGYNRLDGACDAGAFEVDAGFITMSGAVHVAGVPLEGVVLTGLPGPPSTDADGLYSVSVPGPFTGTVTPEKFGYLFDPVSRGYTDASTDLSGQSYAAAVNPAIVTLHEQDFEGGPGGFQIDGAGAGLWHHTNTCASLLPGHTLPGALYFGMDASCTFDTGYAVGGEAASPPIGVHGASPARLEFAYYLGAEPDPTRDIASVLVSVDGGPFQLVASNDPAHGVTPLADPSIQWQTATIDLTPLLPPGAPATVVVLFRFLSVDGVQNDYPGFYVDDVVVQGQGVGVGGVAVPTGSPAWLLALLLGTSGAALLRRAGRRPA